MRRAEPQQTFLVLLKKESQIKSKSCNKQNKQIIFCNNCQFALKLGQTTESSHVDVFGMVDGRCSLYD